MRRLVLAALLACGCECSYYSSAGWSLELTHCYDDYDKAPPELKQAELNRCRLVQERATRCAK